jgi:hydrogenase maturation protease
MPHPGYILLAGVGNALCGDDGVGVHAIRMLQEHAFPGVVMVEIGTGVLHGLSFLEAAERVLILDAVRGGQSPGTIYQFDATAPPEPGARTSIHAMGLIEAARRLLPGRLLPPVAVIGVEPASLEFSLALSTPVQSALPAVVSLAIETVAGWQRTVVARSDPHPHPEQLLCSAF